MNQVHSRYVEWTAYVKIFPAPTGVPANPVSGRVLPVIDALISMSALPFPVFVSKDVQICGVPIDVTADRGK